MTLGRPEISTNGAPSATENGAGGAIGGAIAMAATTDRLFERIEADAELGHYFPDGSAAAHRRHVAALLGQALAGSDRYRGPDVAAAHAHLAVSDRDFDVLVSHVTSTLGELAIAGDVGAHVVDLIARLRPLVVSPAG